MRGMLLLAILWWCCTIGAVEGTAKTAPTLDVKAAAQYLEQNEAELEKWAAVKAAKGTGEFAKKEAAIQKIADRIIDYDFIARFVLGERWETTPKEKRDLFFEKMRALFREFYLEELFYNKSYEKRYIEKGVLKNYLREVPESVFVTTEVQAILKRKPVIYEVIYHLHKPGGDRPYLIFDIELDGVSMIRNYRQQFSKTLKEGTIDDLIKKIDQKLNKQKTTSAPKKGSPKDLPRSTSP